MRRDKDSIRDMIWYVLQERKFIHYQVGGKAEDVVAFVYDLPPHPDLLPWGRRSKHLLRNGEIEISGLVARLWMGLRDALNNFCAENERENHNASGQSLSGPW